MSAWRVPGFTSTGSKRPDVLFGAEAEAGLPTRIAEALARRIPWLEQMRFLKTIGCTASTPIS